MIGASVVGGLVFYLVVRSAIGAILAGVGLPATLAALLLISLFWAFREHSEKYPKGPVTSVDPLTTFSEFPVYWLGRTYNGLDLTQIHTQTESPQTESHIGPLHTVMILTYGYGVCRDKGLESRCSSTPILLILEPACAVARMRYWRQDTLDSYVWTPDVSIRAEGSAPPAKQDLVRALSLANVSKFSEATIVDSITYDARFRSRCGDAEAAPTLPVSR